MALVPLVTLLALATAGPAPATAEPLAATVSVNGGTVAYDVTGHGHAVVLLHGGGLDRRMWDDQLPVLAARYRVIRVDSRGHGLSVGGSGDFSNVDDLYAVLRAVGVEHAVIVGLSLGARTALDFPLAHPEMTDAVVAVSPGMSGYEFTDPLLVARNQELNEAAKKNDVDAVVEILQRSWTDGPERTPDQVPAAVRERVRVMLRENVVKPAGGNMKELDAGHRLGTISCPVLAILGDLDMADIHTIVERIGKEIPGARVAVVRGAAHMVNMEKQEEFNRLLLDFLAGLDRR